VAGARWVLSGNGSLFAEARYDAYFMEVDDGDTFTNADSDLNLNAFSVQGGLRIGF
jgi:hypothetical protein